MEYALSTLLLQVWKYYETEAIRKGVEMCLARWLQVRRPTVQSELLPA